MSNFISIKKKIKRFNKTITVSGDKSLSIWWVLFSSIAAGISKAHNLLISEDVIASIQAIRNLGIKVILKKISVKFLGKALMVTNIKKG